MSVVSGKAVIPAVLRVLDPDDEVVVFEPFYENYGPDAILSGAIPRFVTLHEPDWHFDPAELTAAFNDRTRTITISGLSKTFSATGWRIGWLIAPPEATNAIRKVHDFLTVGAAAPLQEGGVAAMNLPASYYEQLNESYRQRRDLFCPALDKIGLAPMVPDGAYYVMCDTSCFDPDGNDVAFCDRLVREMGVAAVPGSSFYTNKELGRRKIRFAFPKRLETLQLAAERLAALVS